MMKIAVIGANGQLGSDLDKLLRNSEFDYVPLTEDDIDVTNLELTEEVLSKHNPDVVINTAAYHQVDICEDTPEKTFIVNAVGARYVSLVCKQIDAAHVFMSTDYIFDGEKGSPYVESDSPNPISVYGVGKLASEYMIKATTDKYYIARVTGLYGVAGSYGKGGNFVETMLKLAKAGKTIKVVSDQTMTPTYTVDLAKKLIEVIQTKKYGTYHLTNTGECNWYEFARKIFELSDIDADLRPTTSEEFGAKALRPKYSVMDNQHLREIGLEDMRPWQEALKDYLEERKEKYE